MRPGDHPPVARPRIGVLLVNLGTPDAPDARSVRRYLAEFLSDPRVVELPKLLWQPILRGPILMTRPKKSAHAYAQVWRDDGSPLAAITRAQAAGLRDAFGPEVMVDWAMRYGTPSIPERLAALKAAGCERILIAPLYPQYCAATDIVPRQVIAANLCSTPSAQLLQHEWAKHGTCMPGETPASFFRRSTGMYARLRYPDMNALSRRPLTAGQFATALARANPGLRADMMRITANREGWLDEVWLCLDRKFAFATCPAHQGGLAADARLRIWRGPR